MKHIGWCLERIQVEMSYIPKEVISKEDKDKANHILNEVQEYANTLAELIQHPKFRKSLDNLEESSIERVILPARKVEELFKDLEHMLYVLDLYINNLREIIKNHPEQWSKKADQLVLMIDQKFGAYGGYLRKEFQITIHIKEELQKIVKSEKHLAEFLKLK